MNNNDCPKCESDDTYFEVEKVRTVDRTTQKQIAIRICNFCKHEWEYEPDEFIDLSAFDREDEENKRIGEYVKSHSKFCDCAICVSW